MTATTGRITILVSHRFSTVRMADLIVVLDGARVVEVGTPRRAHGQGGTYAVSRHQRASYMRDAAFGDYIPLRSQRTVLTSIREASTPGSRPQAAAADLDGYGPSSERARRSGSHGAEAASRRGHDGGAGNRLYRAPVLEGAGDGDDAPANYAKAFVANAEAGVGLIIQGSSCLYDEAARRLAMTVVSTRRRCCALPRWSVRCRRRAPPSGAGGPRRPVRDGGVARAVQP